MVGDLIKPYEVCLFRESNAILKLFPTDKTLHQFITDYDTELALC